MTLFWQRQQLVLAVSFVPPSISVFPLSWTGNLTHATILSEGLFLVQLPIVLFWINRKQVVQPLNAVLAFYADNHCPERVQGQILKKYTFARILETLRVKSRVMKLWYNMTCISTIKNALKFRAVILTMGQKVRLCYTSTVSFLCSHISQVYKPIELKFGW